MAQPDLQKFNRRGLAIKLQSSEGAPETPDAGADGLRLYDGQSGTEVDVTEDNVDRPHFAGNQIYVSNRRAFIQGNFRLYPPQTPGDASDGTPDCHIALLPGGMTRVLDAAGRKTTYNPISEAIPVATAYWWHAGTHKRVTDARNAISALALTVGQRFQGQLRVQGSYEDVLEEALPSITLSDTDGPVVEADNSRTQITELPGGSPLNVWGKSLSLDFGSQLQTKEFTEHKTNSIDGRTPTWTLRLARTAKVDFDPWAVRDAGTFITAALRVKQDDGRYSMLSIRGQVRDINEADIDGDYGWELSGPCVASSAGGDEFLIEFGDVSLNLTGTLSDGTQSTAYSGTTALTAEGEYTAPLAWDISAGTLPSGLSINAGTGEISGTPDTVEEQTFTVRATSADGQIATREQTVDIAAP